MINLSRLHRADCSYGIIENQLFMDINQTIIAKNNKTNSTMDIKEKNNAPRIIT